MTQKKVELVTAIAEIMTAPIFAEWIIYGKLKYRALAVVLWDRALIAGMKP